MNNKHITFLKIADNLSTLSKCKKHKVGALIVKDNKIISHGVNGTPKDYINCCDKYKDCDLTIEPYKTEHRIWSEKFEIHAEVNAILNALNNNNDLKNATLYCNLEPCFNCVKHMAAVGIKNIYYNKKHKSNLTECTDIKDLMFTLDINIQYINNDLHN